MHTHNTFSLNVHIFVFKLGVDQKVIGAALEQKHSRKKKKEEIIHATREK
jgi:hypothetical protein